MDHAATWRRIKDMRFLAGGCFLGAEVYRPSGHAESPYLSKRLENRNLLKFVVTIPTTPRFRPHRAAFGLLEGRSSTWVDTIVLMMRN